MILITVILRQFAQWTSLTVSQLCSHCLISLSELQPSCLLKLCGEGNVPKQNNCHQQSGKALALSCCDWWTPSQSMCAGAQRCMAFVTEVQPTDNTHCITM